MSVFGQDYAAIYDGLYEDYDFDADVADILASVEKHMPASIAKRSLLDIGCGTGSHLLRLERHFNVNGVDLSDAMLSVCKGKLDVPLAQGDAKNFDLSRKFNVILLMNAVLGYQTDNASIISTLKNVRRHLMDDGLLIFDVWDGNTVLSDRPTARIKQYTTNGTSVIRAVKPLLLHDINVCECEYTWYIHSTNALTVRNELHRVRYFFNQELEAHLTYQGFDVLEVRPPRRVGASNWHKLYVAKPSQNNS